MTRPLRDVRDPDTGPTGGLDDPSMPSRPTWRGPIPQGHRTTVAPERSCRSSPGFDPGFRPAAPEDRPPLSTPRRTPFAGGSCQWTPASAQRRLRMSSEWRRFLSPLSRLPRPRVSKRRATLNANRRGARRILLMESRTDHIRSPARPQIDPQGHAGFVAGQTVTACANGHWRQIHRPGRG